VLAGVPGADVSIYSEVLSRFEVAGVTGFLDRDGFSRPAALRWTMIGVDLLVVMATVALVSGRTFQPSVAMGAGLLAGLALVAVVTLRGGYRHRQWDVPGRDLRVLVSAIGIPAAVAISLSYFRIVSIPRNCCSGSSWRRWPVPV